MIRFIDIHTHKPEENENEFIVYNSFQFDKLPPRNIKFSAGIHPLFIENTDWQVERMRLFVKMPNCVAIGECGLDKRKKHLISLQERIFIRQINEAAELGKPLIIHNVGYGYKILEILKVKKFGYPFIFHGFNQKIELAKAILKAGGYLSFGYAILNENSNAAKVLKEVPLDRVFLETDDSACGLHKVYEKAAEILGLELNRLKKTMIQNFYKVFEINLL